MSATIASVADRGVTGVAPPPPWMPLEVDTTCATDASSTAPTAVARMSSDPLSWRRRSRDCGNPGSARRPRGGPQAGLPPCAIGLVRRPLRLQHTAGRERRPRGPLTAESFVPQEEGGTGGGGEGAGGRDERPTHA